MFGIRAGADRIVTGLFRRVYSWIIRRAINTRDTIFGISFLRLRENYSLPLPGEDEPQDARAKAAVTRFFAWDTEFTPVEHEDDWVQWLESDADSCANRRLHLQIQHWLRSSTADGPRIVARYRQLFDEDIGEIDEGSIVKEHYRLGKELKAIRKRYLKAIAWRIPISVKKLAFAVPAMSVAMALGGYFYTSRVHDHFGVNVSRFFTVGDYLSSAIHAVEAAALAAVIVGISAAWGAVSALNLTEYARSKAVAQDKWLLRVILISCVVGLFRQDQTTWWFALAFCVVSLPIVDYSLNRIFRRSLALVLCTWALVVFSTILYVESNAAIKLIEDGQDNQDFRILSQSSEFTSQTYSIIGSSDRYLFLWDRSGNRVHAIPHTKINRMSFSGVTE